MLANKKKAQLKQNLPLHLMLVPAVIWAVIFGYAPMGGVVIAFQDFKPALGLFGAQEFVGLDNFKYMFDIPDFWGVIRNTLVISISNIVFNLVVPIVFALFLNEVRHMGLKRTIQTISYLPHFLSWVILSGIFIDILSPSNGSVTALLKALHLPAPDFLGDPKVFPITVIVTNAQCKTSVTVNGTAVKFAGANASSSGPESAPPVFRFGFGYPAVVAKAIEELPDIYQTLNAYGSIHTYRYRVFKMEVLDPLESGMEGTFFYALPERLKGDLTQYDALLLSMSQRGNDFIMLNADTNELTAFSSMFVDPYNTPELGNIIAFTDNVFDESLWQDRSWIYGYQFARHYLDEGKGYDEMLVYRGSTLEDALSTMARIQDEWGTWYKPATVKKYDFQTAAAKDAAAFIKPFENGIFVPNANSAHLRYYRYIGGCPTNEWIMIDPETEEVTRSEYSFSDHDFENLPDVAAYVESLDLASIVPQHTDTNGKDLLFNSAIGWYEKTASGVSAIVKIAWRHCDENDCLMQYYDETFILLENRGERIISREELIALIGENQNIWDGEYGVGYSVPT